MVGRKWSGQVYHPTKEIVGKLGTHPYLADVLHARLRKWKAQRNQQRERGARQHGYDNLLGPESAVNALPQLLEDTYHTGRTKVGLAGVNVGVTATEVETKRETAITMERRRIRGLKEREANSNAGGSQQQIEWGSRIPTEKVREDQPTDEQSTDRQRC